jgi:hypothetical protein
MAKYFITYTGHVLCPIAVFIWNLVIWLHRKKKFLLQNFRTKEENFKLCSVNGRFIIGSKILVFISRYNPNLHHPQLWNTIWNLQPVDCRWRITYPLSYEFILKSWVWFLTPYIPIFGTVDCTSACRAYSMTVELTGCYTPFPTLAGHLQAEYIIILGSYFTQNESVFVLLLYYIF